MPQYLSLAESHIPYTSQYFHISVGSATYDRYDLCFVLGGFQFEGFQFGFGFQDTILTG